MTVAYVDTSCLVAVAFAEPGHEVLAARLAAIDRLHSSNLTEAELGAALSRKGAVNDGSITGRISWVLPDRTLSPEIKAVLATGYLRGADLWHLACALYLSPDPRELLFLTADHRQAEVAAALGFPGQGRVTRPPAAGVTADDPADDGKRHRPAPVTYGRRIPSRTPDLDRDDQVRG